MPPRTLFADAFYWVALIFPRDTFHARVRSFSATLGPARLVTTDEVLTEVLNHFSHLGPIWRAKVAALVQDVRNDPGVDVLPQNRADFDAALALYEPRPDKAYSLTDCRSMLALQSLRVSEVLTNDHHFTQEGFTILFPGP
jgi:predicted nucleic acid-binding protein